jgi:hypothetical protein
MGAARDQGQGSAPGGGGRLMAGAGRDGRPARVEITTKLTYRARSVSYEVPETNVRAGSGAACGSARLYPGRHPSTTTARRLAGNRSSCHSRSATFRLHLRRKLASVSQHGWRHGLPQRRPAAARGSASGGACFARGRMGGERGHAGLHHRQVAADPRPARLDRSPRAVVVRTNLLEDSQHALGTLARPDSEQLVAVESRLFSRHPVTLLGPTPKFTCKGTKSTRAARPRAIHSVQRRGA